MWRPYEGLSYVSIQQVDIKSRNADGSFMVRGASGTLLNSANTTWTFHEEMTGGTHNVGTCSGTMLFTIHD